jgi:crossover junction endodeoxyribonuclease RuvC
LKILGIDPGLRITGYGLIETAQHKGLLPKSNLIEAGLVRTSDQSGIANRLQKIHRCLAEAITEFKPDWIAIEKLYAHYEHPSTAILMGHARGVVCLLAGQFDIPLVSVASTHVKKAVTGHGHASKEQVQRMVMHLLCLKEAQHPADVTDALAVALACASLSRSGWERRSLRAKVPESQKEAPTQPFTDSRLPSTQSTAPKHLSSLAQRKRLLGDAK